MTNHVMHTIDEALGRFCLEKGTGDGKETACAMTMLSWVHDETWTDSPDCAHPVIRNNVVNVNDTELSHEQRAEIVRRGEYGVLDTWWIPTEVVVWAFSGERGEKISGYERLLRALTRIADWKTNKAKPNLVGADLVGAYLVGANLAGAYLVGANLARAYLVGANLARANLVGADLAGANLVGADLVGANLVGADLAGADLVGAYLVGAYRPSDPPDGWESNADGFLVRKGQGA